jgi:hypothetical protein
MMEAHLTILHKPTLEPGRAFDELLRFFRQATGPYRSIIRRFDSASNVPKVY